jgi:hypothetical protein
MVYGICNEFEGSRRIYGKMITLCFTQQITDKPHYFDEIMYLFKRLPNNFT